jgi:cleavage and polyadenylation specificity factor subunit 1
VSATGGCKKNTLSLFDRHSGLSFLIDTGADVSVLPASSKDKVSRTPSAPLIAANGSPIRSWGRRSCSLFFGGKRLFKQDFYVAEVTQPILGADFFSNNHLAIDVRGRRVIDLDSKTSYSTCMASSPPNISGLSTCPSNKFSRILQEFPEILVPHFNSSVNKHGVEHFIVTHGPPLHARARRLDDEKLAVAKEEFLKMEKLGIIRRSNSPWASPLHVVPKSNGGWRPCGDYRRLNEATVDDRYPLPHIMDFNGRLTGSRIFSKIDLVKGYHQIPMAESSIPKTAIITPFGLWEFLRMPFGLKNSAQAFQRLMDGVLRDIPFAFVYLDDILIASKSEEEHQQHLRYIFSLLSANGLVVNRDKCVFGVTEIDFLGHRVTTTGIRPMPDRVTAIQNYPVPTNKASLQRFLGMINFYHRFMPGIAGKLAPLHALCRGHGPDIAWSEECQSAFISARSALATATLLHHPKPDATTSITVDASDVAVGAQLEQRHQGRWVPIAFFSKKLSDAEKKYSAFDRELLAAYLAIKHFRHFVEGRHFTLFTDHKPLTFAMASSVDRSRRQTRHRTLQSSRQICST